MEDSQVIKLVEFSKKFGSFQAVYPTDLQIKKGEIYALLGPNGGGKTTMADGIVIFVENIWYK